MKSTWRHRFSAIAVVDAQYWPRTIQRRIRKGLHPFPNKNRTSLKVSWSPGGFFQNTSLISLGHDFNGGNASPPIAFKSLFLSSPISFLHKSRCHSGFGPPPRIWTPRSRSASGFGPPGPNLLADMDPSRGFGPPWKQALTAPKRLKSEIISVLYANNSVGFYNYIGGPNPRRGSKSASGLGPPLADLDRGVQIR